ncbi:MAG: RNA polymerase sigma factor SigZ [Chloroflexi bacterium CFX1]|nr:RNA polymerase sigma factor SigZ [Chloroflexi bacterium CFX1]MCQ3954252.1 RNA polymerase sigma factor SigZ [Chloroflexota bacterium]MDL1920759.1 RNA polymerase sigma factor SigZ [Chloroflexi bacterium CFX5]NUQ60310.1 RNA polymerase sigma factor SigZ [Anaerolineales bacterium]
MNATLETIYTDFHSKLHRFIAGRVPDPDTADDILQDVYLKIHAKIGGLRAEDRLKSWVYQITRNAIIDYYRRACPQDELTESLASPLDDEPDAVSQLASSVKGMLGCLDDKYREALELTELQGLSQVELATRLDITVSGAKSRVQRAREKLKEAFLDCCHFKFDRLGKVVDYHPNCEKCADPNYPNNCGDSEEEC